MDRRNLAASLSVIYGEMLHDLRTDLRDAGRTLLHRPAFGLLAVLTLAVGMSVNTVAFSAVNALLFKGPAVENLDSLGWVFAATRGNPLGDVSLVQYEALRNEARTLDALVVEGRHPLRVRLEGRTEMVWSLIVSADYFEALGIRPAAGRLFGAGDKDRDVAVVSEAFWRSRLDGRPPGGATIVLADQPFAVVGVLPAGFQGPGGVYVPDVWVPLERRSALGLSPELALPGRDWLTAFGRRRAGVTAAQASADLTSILRRIEGAPAERDGGIRARFAPMADGHPETRALSFVAALGMAAVGGVLLIACFNVAGLIMARASERRREMAVRSALGASPGRLTRQLVTEGLVLATVAGILALALSLTSGRLLSVFSLPAPIPQKINLDADVRSVGFTLLLVLVGGLLPTLLPARYATRLDLQQVLASEAGTATGNRRRTRARWFFQTCQVAGSTLFLALAVLFTGSFRDMLSADPGFDTRGVLLAATDPHTHGLQPRQAEAFFQGLAEQVRPDPRVRQVAASTGVPYAIGGMRGTTLGLGNQDCRTTRCQPVQLYVGDPGYLRAIGTPLVAGRDLAERDRAAGGGIVVSQATAQKLWPGRNPIGEMVTVGTSGEVAEVVGVAADIKALGLVREPSPVAYRAMRTADYSADNIMLVVGVHGDPAAFADSVRRAAAELDATLPVRIQTMSENLRLPLWPARVAAYFLGTCGALAVLLATVGLFGVVSQSASQRTREFGIRMALGATRRSVLRTVIAEGLVLTAAGGILGLLVARGLAALTSTALVGVRGSDWSPYLFAAALQAAVALVACSYPAHRAARADVLAVMRSEH